MDRRSFIKGAVATSSLTAIPGSSWGRCSHSPPLFQYDTGLVFLRSEGGNEYRDVVATVDSVRTGMDYCVWCGDPEFYIESNPFTVGGGGCPLTLMSARVVPDPGIVLPFCVERGRTPMVRVDTEYRKNLVLPATWQRDMYWAAWLP